MKESDVITETLPLPVFGHSGEPCPACGAPLAGDQRYCLHCGARRPEARLEFLDVLGADARTDGTGGFAAAAPIAAPPAAGAPVGLNAWLQARSGVIGLAALLLLTLLIGLLLGHWASSGGDPVAAQPAAPQVIKLEGTGAAAPAAAAATTDGAAGSGSGGSTAKSGASAAKAKASDAKAAKVPRNAVSVKKLAGDKKALEKAIKKGKPIATGGTPPPKDNKPAGGGSSFEEIG